MERGYVIVELAGYRCCICGREFMLREPILPDCDGGRHRVEYVVLRRELPRD